MYNDDTSNESPFESLQLMRKHVPQFSGTHYRIYTDEKNYTRVEANSAVEALQKFGNTKIFRIERDTIYLNRIVEIPALTDEVVEKAAHAEPSAPVIENAAHAVKPELTDLAEVAKETTALSGSEVEQLIQGDSNGAA